MSDEEGRKGEKKRRWGFQDVRGKGGGGWKGRTIEGRTGTRNRRQGKKWSPEGGGKAALSKRGMGWGRGRRGRMCRNRKRQNERDYQGDRNQ